MKIIPIKTRVLIKPDIPESTFGDSVLERPDIAKDAPNWGTVIGSGTETELKVGDRVFFPWATGVPKKINGELHFIMRESDIMAVEE